MQSIHNKFKHAIGTGHKQIGLWSHLCSTISIETSGKAPGILTGDEALAKYYMAQGCLFVAVGADQNVLRDSATALAQRFKS